MAEIILTLLGTLYVALGVWCIVAPEATSRKVGLFLVGGAGRSEFAVVYGGLEIALGIFFLMRGFDADLRRAGVLLALISSAGLALTRTATLVFVDGIPRSTYAFYGAEVVMTAAAAFAFLRHSPE